MVVELWDSENEAKNVGLSRFSLELFGEDWYFTPHDLFERSERARLINLVPLQAINPGKGLLGTAYRGGLGPRAHGMSAGEKSKLSLDILFTR